MHWLYLRFYKLAWRWSRMTKSCSHRNKYTNNLIYYCCVWWRLSTICLPCKFKNNGMSCIRIKLKNKIIAGWIVTPHSLVGRWTMDYNTPQSNYPVTFLKVYWHLKMVLLIDYSRGSQPVLRRAQRAPRALPRGSAAAPGKYCIGGSWE
jgi:hypothetical protein